MGPNLGNLDIPLNVDADVFDAVKKLSNTDETDRLQSWYKYNSGTYTLNTEKYKTRDLNELVIECQKLQNLLESKFRELLSNVRQDQHINEQICDKIKQFQAKALEHEINQALGE